MWSLYLNTHDGITIRSGYLRGHPPAGDGLAKLSTTPFLSILQAKDSGRLGAIALA